MRASRFPALALAALLLLAGLIHGAPCPAQAGSEQAGLLQFERVLDFSARMAVHADGTMTVTETIRVNALGRDIKRGIYRDLMTLYQDPLGNDFRVGYEFTQVLRNGKTEPWHTENRRNAVRLYVGEASTLLDPGIHEYRITYVTDRQIGFFQDFDEIYWNVTGNDWFFTIDRAEVVVELPDGAEPLKWAAYTGRWGDQGQNFAQDLDPDGNIRFTTTASLEPGQGLTIAVAWPKGFVAEPSRAEKFLDLLKDNRFLAVGLAGVLLVWCWLLTAWFFVGRDPAKGVIVPLFAPPPDLSPAEARFIRRMKFDNKCLSAALVNIAVKGHITIKNKGRNSFTLIQGEHPVRDLSPDESAAKEKLMSGRTSLSLTSGNHGRVSRALNAMRRSVKKSRGGLFARNSGWVKAALLPAAAAYIGSAAMLRRPMEQALMGLMFAFWFGLGLFMLLKALRGFLGPDRRAPGTTPRSILLLFLSAPVCGSALVFLYNAILGNGYSPVFPFLALALGGTLLLFKGLMRAPTRQGRRVLDQIDGLRMYMQTAEQERLNQLNPPDKTPELFEKLLPYALALDVEVAWCEQFAHILDVAAGGYEPQWYGGDLAHMGVLAAGLGAGLHSAVTSASISPASRSRSGSYRSSSPSSFSGSSGGGFSGGGGGGGGGGGW